MSTIEIVFWIATIINLCLLVVLTAESVSTISSNGEDFMDDKLQPFFSGFDMGGWRHPKGHIQLGKYCIPDWPEEITVFGNRYELEEVKYGSYDPAGAQWENAIYV